MKRSQLWWIGGLVVLVGILTILFIGRAQLSDLEEENSALEAELIQVQTELDSISSVYPPREFVSLEELENWLAQNDVSEMNVEYDDIEARYSQALRLQYEASLDGFIVSADYDWPIYVYCITIIEGKIYVWEPASDYPELWEGLGPIIRE
jgi:hypothetical protein